MDETRSAGTLRACPQSQVAREYPESPVVGIATVCDGAARLRTFERGMPSRGDGLGSFKQTRQVRAAYPMTVDRMYPSPYRAETLVFPGSGGAVLDTGYARAGAAARRLLEETAAESGRRDAHIDWSLGVSADNPARMPDETIGVYGSPLWRRLSDDQRRELRRHSQSFILSQTFQGTQITLLCAARLIQRAPNHDVRRYAALQAADDARHIELHLRLMSAFGLVYPPNTELKRLCQDALSLDRWDLLLLATNVLFKNVSVATIQLVRDMSGPSLARQVNAVIMLEQTRHAAFGRAALQEHYQSASAQTRSAAEALLVDWSEALHERLPMTTEVSDALGFTHEDALPTQDASEIVNMFRAVLFQRIVPNARAIGLWGPKVQACFRRLGVLHFADIDLDTFLAADRRVLREAEAELAAR